MMYSVKLRKTHCDRTFGLSLVAIIIVGFMFYVASKYMAPMGSHLRAVQGGVYAMEQRDPHPEPETFYGIIFDAGSTGSRIHIFELKKAGSDARAELVKETFKAIKPGLSSYSLNPKKGVETLKPLLDLAASTIPARYHKSTPIALKATAGLRLLPEKTADDILHEVRQLFSQYDFLFHKDDDDIAIMKGTDEGIYMWVTVNFLLGALTGKTETVAALDLGGGSTQVTFVPTDMVSLKKLPRNKINTMRLFNRTYQLFSHSYLGVGLMAARMAILGHKPPATMPPDPNVRVRTSACLPANYVGNWSVQSTDIIIKGLPDDQAGYDNCYKEVKLFVDNITAIPGLGHHPVYIFSYYFDRAIDAGIIATENGATITPLHYGHAAKMICNGFSQPKHPFICFDLTYIYSLLTDGFGLSPNHPLHIYKKINNIEMSWALGSMFGLMSETSNNHH